jgi:hypothetical protein
MEELGIVVNDNRFDSAKWATYCVNMGTDDESVEQQLRNRAQKQRGMELMALIVV